jgi:hypothetical protein
MIIEVSELQEIIMLMCHEGHLASVQMKLRTNEFILMSWLSLLINCDTIFSSFFLS